MMRRTLMAASIIGVCVSASDAAGQARPTVFIHGFAAEALDWAATADRLKARVAIAPHMPKVSWKEKFDSQGRQVESQLSSLATNSIAVGHSNGGVVAREWARLRQLGGIVTIGTPHRGVPLLTNLPGWAAFTGSTRGLVNEVFTAFWDTTDWTSILAIVESALLVTSDYSLWSLTNLISVLGVTTVTPVMPQMTPNSAYLTTLNGSSNLSKEASRAPKRVGIVSVASNFYLAGPARAIAPDQADEIATTMYAASSTLLFWGNYILINAESPWRSRSWQSIRPIAEWCPESTEPRAPRTTALFRSRVNRTRVPQISSFTARPIVSRNSGATMRSTRPWSTT